MRRSASIIVIAVIILEPLIIAHLFFFFFSSRRRHTRFDCDWSSDVCSSDLADAPDSVIQRAESIRPIKATDIRRVVKQVFRKRFGASAEDLGGGDWRYVANYSGRTFDVSIDYGGEFRKFSSQGGYNDETSGLHPPRPTHEREPC